MGGRNRDRERGDGAEKSLILPLPPPDEHTPDYYPWAPLSSTQQLAAPRLLPIDYSRATAGISLSRQAAAYCTAGTRLASEGQIHL